MTLLKKDNRGGARPGTGPKLKYGEPTIRLAFRCPESKVDLMLSLIKKRLKSYEALQPK